MRRRHTEPEGVRGRADRIRRDWGRVVDVSKRRAGRTVKTAADAGDTVVEVKNGSLFGDRGWVKAGDQVTRHTGWDEDTGLLALVDPLEAALEAGDRVLVYDRGRQTVVTDLEVLVDRDDDGGAPLPVVADARWIHVLPVGPREDDEGEVVRIEYDPDDDEWSIEHVVGLAEVAGYRWEDAEGESPHVLTGDEVAAGFFVHQLEHERVRERSLQVAWWALVQPSTNWSLDADGGVLTYTLAGNERAGDEFHPHYEYLPGPRRDRDSFLLDWGSPGWKHLEVAGSDTTNRSGTGYDDSSWAAAAAPFGDDLGHPFDYIPGLNWPAPVTDIPTLGKTWLRTDLVGWSGPLTVSVRCDNEAAVYWNGTLLGNTTAGTVGEYSFEVSGGQVTGDDVVAVRGYDTGPSNAYNHAYLDVKVESA